MNFPKIRLLLVSGILVQLVFAGCSALNPFSSSEPEQTVQGSSEPVAADIPAVADTAPSSTQPAAEIAEPVRATGGAVQPAVEVMWQVPSDPVEIYHLSYGSDPQKLDRTVKIPVRSLEKIDHPAYGPIFHFQLSDVDPTKDIFISLRAENNSGISEPTPPMKISPNSPRLNR